ncbi:MAG: snoRNA-binding rRNA-processing protein utp10 [Candelina mexicana]|nr:MAG: snoRNA-binding rRNA-processing protein utp10 [Candelina mexicana]
MASSLAKQLSQIAATSTNSHNLKAQKSAHAQSLIFDSKVAAVQDFNTIYQICHEGYQELCLLDPRFAKFARSIFSEQSKTQERTQMTAKQNEELDKVIEDFLGLAGGKVLLKPAFKAVEWLIRRFRVHEYNTSCLLLTLLPYHTTPIFSSFLSILPSNLPSTFKFLHPYMRSLTVPARHAIVYTAIHNQAFLAALNAYVLKVSRARHHHHALLSFWAGIMAEALTGIIDLSRSGRRTVQKQNEQDVLLRILPVLSEGLVIKKVPDLRVGCYMLVTILATKANLDDRMLTNMMEAVVVGWTTDTSHAGLICLALLARRRIALRLPDAVLRAIMNVQGLEVELTNLHPRYRVDRLALALLLGVIANLHEPHGVERLPFLEKLMGAQILNNDQYGLVCESILLKAQQAGSNESSEPDLRAQLGDSIVRLTELGAVGEIMRNKMKGSNIDMDLLEMRLQMAIRPAQISIAEGYMDIEMKSPITSTHESFENAALSLPTRTADELSFLSSKRSFVFSTLSDVFQLATSSPGDLAKFAGLPILRKELALQEPLFISFFIRMWCGSYPVLVRTAALRTVSQYLSDLEDTTVNLQAVLPYVLPALADSSDKVRLAAAAVIAAINSIHKRIEMEGKKRKEVAIWGHDELYGQSGQYKALHWLSADETVKIFEQALFPSLEECVLDSNHIEWVLKSALGRSSYPSHAHAQTNTVELKTALRVALLTFLGGHIEITPLYIVKLRLLKMLNRTGKVGSTSRTKILLPTLRRWASLGMEKVSDIMKNESIDLDEIEMRMIGIVMPDDREGLQFLQSVIEGRIGKKRPSLVKAVFREYLNIWSSLKADTILSVARFLFGFSFDDDLLPDLQVYRSDAMEVLQNVVLPTSVLQDFIDQLPTGAQMQDMLPAAKRRRTNDNVKTDTNGSGSPGLVAAIRKVTFVLELVDSSNPKVHPQLLKGLFSVLGELQDLKSLLGSELGYLQELVLGSLLGIVKGLQTTTFDHSSVRVDLLIDCARTTASHQVQNAALLLVASLANLTPELVLHNVMAIFTFMGTTMLRQDDEYSAHVIDHTIHQVVPPLVQSLRKENTDIVSGVSGLLLSFVAAFEHIPAHRRSKLYISLVEVLGPEDFLFALLALLADKYAGDGRVQDFAIALAAQFSVDIQIASAKKYVDLITDTLLPQRTLSALLFHIDEQSDHNVQGVALNLLRLLRRLLAQPRLNSQVGRLFRQDQTNAVRARELFSVTLENLLSLAERVRDHQGLRGACGDALASLLGLLSMAEFLKSVDSILDRPENELRRKILKSINLRIQAEAQADEAAQGIIVNLLRRLTHIVENSSDTSLTHAAIVSIDQISEKYGKKYIEDVTTAAGVMTGNQALGSKDNRIRIIALLCLASIADVIGAGIVSFLPQALPKALEHLKQSLSEESGDKTLQNAVYSFLSGLFVHVPWIVTGANLDRILKLSHESAELDLGHEVDESRASMLQLLARQADPKEAFSALERTLGHALAEGPFAAKDHLQVLITVVDKHKKSVIVTNAQILSNSLMDALDLRRTRNSENYDPEDVEEIESITIDVAIQMIYKMNDSTFRPLFVKLVEWATTSLGRKDKRGRMLRLTSLYNLLYKFFDTLKSIVTGYSSYVIDNAVEVISNVSPKDPDSVVLWTGTIRTLLKTFEHDQDDFWQSLSHFSAISSPLLAQLAHASTLPIMSEVVPAITELAAAADSAEHHKEMNTAILKHLRSDDAQVRFAAVKCEESLAERLGEEWLALLPEMLPLISELQEDDDEDVEKATHRWVIKIEGILGESLDAMLQ